MSITNSAFHHTSVDESLNKLHASKNGLQNQEVKQRQKKHGSNQIEQKKEKSLFKLFLEQLNNPIIYLLAAAVLVSFIFGDVVEGVAILIVIVLNTAIGFWMEYQAQASVKALKKLDQLKAHVIREGKTMVKAAKTLVPGDVILLESGDMVPADARVIEASELTADESPLTGESVPVSKITGKIDEDAPLAERKNMLFKGTAITNGKGMAIVTATGNHTEIGKISSMVKESDDEEIPLNRKLGKLSHHLIWVILGLALLFFVFGWIAGKEIYLLLQTSIAWTVAAIPEGLAIVASIALARGMLRLSRKNVIVKKLEAVETLGETTVIFTDKTGTLTKNKLSVNFMAYPGTEQTLDNKQNEQDPKTADDFDEKDNFYHLYHISVFCNDAKWLDNEKLKGDPLDASLHKFAKRLYPEKYEALLNTERLHEDPFDSESKFMGTVHPLNDKLYVAGKGAAEVMLKRSNRILQKGEVKELDKASRQQWLQKNEELSEKGLRIIAYAYKTLPKNDQQELLKKEDFIHNMVFAGFMGFIDPARKDIQPAIEKCHQAGIKVVMVTGDHKGIARNIAHEVNLTDKANAAVIQGKNLEQKKEQINDTKLFARVDPEQKLDIVDDYKKAGAITAMTGDGVNDAPALKKADIGIAMGDKGTQVAQDVADMVLTDDAFPSIVEAIEQGRVIFGNIRRFIVYQLSYHLAEIIIIAGISFTLFYLPLLPLQLLFLNLLSDVFPALALGLGQGDDTIMKQPPKKPDEPILTRKNWGQIMVYGLIMSVCITGVYLLAMFAFNTSKEVANTITFFSLAFSQLLHVFNMRDAQEHPFNNQITRNPYIWYALAICAVFLLLGYFVPFLSELLSLQTLQLVHWALIGGATLSTLLISQLLKPAMSRFFKPKA